jgi:hypothetical protein
MESAHCCGRDEGGSVVPIEGGGELERGGNLGTRQAATDYGGNGWSLRGVGDGGFYAHDDEAIERIKLSKRR